VNDDNDTTTSSQRQQITQKYKNNSVNYSVDTAQLTVWGCQQ